MKVVNIKKTKNYNVYIGRGGPYGNPFEIGKDGTRDEVVDKYKEWFYAKIEKDANFKERIHSLQGKVLGCFCYPLRCHGDVIIEYLNSIQKKETKVC